MTLPKKKPEYNAFLNLLPNAQGLVLVSGLLTYGVLYYAYDYFYAVLNLAPQDVGLSYLDILTHSTGAVIVASYVIVVTVLEITRTGGDAVAQQASPSDDGARLADNVRLKASEVLIAIFCVIATLGAGYLLIWYVVIPLGSRIVRAPLDNRRAELLRGEQVEPIRVLGLTFLDLRATPARLSRKDKKESIIPSEAPLPMENTTDATDLPCVLYLGRSDDTLVVYNPFHREILRVPAEGVQIATGGKMLTSECRNDPGPPVPIRAPILDLPPKLDLPPVDDLPSVP